MNIFREAKRLHSALTTNELMHSNRCILMRKVLQSVLGVVIGRARNIKARLSPVSESAYMNLVTVTFMPKQ